MDFGALPPEINSARMYAGAGPGPLLAASTAWDGLAADLHSAAAGYQSVVTGLTAGSWQGPASVSMAAAAAPYVTWMSATAAQAEQTATQAKAAASAYEAAFAMTVPPPVIAANRAQLMTLIATNLLGQNTPAIMATEAHYGEMWAQDAAAMYGYAGSAGAASTLTPFAPPPQNTNPGGLASQTAAVAHTAGTSAGTHAQTMTSSLSNVPQTLQGLAQPVQSTSSTAGMSQMALGTGTSAATSAATTPASMLTGMTGASGKGALKGAGKGAGLGASAAALPGALPELSNAGGIGLALDTAGFAEDGVGLVGLDGGGLGVDFGGLGLDFLGADTLTEGGGFGPLGSFGGLGGLGPLHGLGGLGGGLGGAGASAGVGQAASLSGMSVPQNWFGSAPLGAIHPASAMPLPSTNLGAAAPAVAPGGTAVPKLVMPGVSGREVDGAVRAIGFRSSVVPHSPMAG